MSEIMSKPQPQMSTVARTVSEIRTAANDATTVNQMDVGDSFEGRLNEQGDVDWIKVDLEAGQSYRIKMNDAGMSTGDPALYLLDADENVVSFNDDLNPDEDRFNAQIEYYAAVSGTYFIVADSFESEGRGDYRINVKTYQPDVQSLTSTIDWGSALPGTNPTTGGAIDVFFAPTWYEYYDPIDDETYVAENWNAYERAQFQLAFDTIAAITKLTFNIVTNEASADLKLINDRDQLSAFDSLGFFNPPGTTDAGIGVFAADSWDRQSDGDLEPGGEGFVTIVHELLHGLGLAHPHDDGGTSQVAANVTAAFDDTGDFLLNQGIYTTMSYNSGFSAGSFGTLSRDDRSIGFEATPMALDIAVLQSKYGANMNTAMGASSYVLGDENVSGAHWSSIWDAGGTDEITYGGARDVFIDLRAATLVSEYGGAGFISAVKGIQGGFTIAHGVEIENAQGGTGDDTLQGNEIANILNGAQGADVLSGAAGDDVLKGGAMSDLLIGGFGDDDLSGGRGADTLFGGRGNDTLLGQKNNDVIAGRQGDDVLVGGRGRDVLSGGDGRDRLEGGLGNDVLSGGNKADAFVFQGSIGADRVTDLAAIDSIEIAAQIADGRSAQQLAADATQTGGGLILDLNEWGQVTLSDFTDRTALSQMIEITGA